MRPADRSCATRRRRFGGGCFPRRRWACATTWFSDVGVPHLKHYSVLSLAEFEADLTYLQRTFGFLTYDQLAQRRSSADAVRDNSVILTFDDGFAECASVVAPVCSAGA